MVTSIGRAMPSERVRSVLDCSRSCLWVRDGSAGSYREASCPKKTRATFIWRYNYRTPRRSTARTRRRVKSKTFISKIPGIKYTTTVVGFSLLSIVQGLL